MFYKNTRYGKRPEYRKLYSTKAWRLKRQEILLRDLYKCQWPGCGALLNETPPMPRSPVVHHIQDHKGDIDLFLRDDNLMAICKQCHDGPAQKRVPNFTYDENGNPVGAINPWENRR